MYSWLSTNSILKNDKVSSEIIIIYPIWDAVNCTQYEEAVIERRYIRGIKNLFDIYLPVVDDAHIFDNSEGIHHLLAKKQNDGVLNIVNRVYFNFSLTEHPYNPPCHAESIYTRPLDSYGMTRKSIWYGCESLKCTPKPGTFRILYFFVELAYWNNISWDAHSVFTRYFMS